MIWQKPVARYGWWPSAPAENRALFHWTSGLQSFFILIEAEWIKYFVQHSNIRRRGLVIRFLTWTSWCNASALNKSCRLFIYWWKNWTRIPDENPDLEDKYMNFLISPFFVRKFLDAACINCSESDYSVTNQQI